MRPGGRKGPVLSRAEWGLLLVLAAVQFTHILEFVVVMPLGPDFAEGFAIRTQQFGWMVSAYSLAACVSGLCVACFLDRFDRKTALLMLYAGFTVGTLLCAAAPTFESLVVARAVAGGFAGVLGTLVLAVVGDAIPDQRRGTAMGVVMSAFSVASIVGVPAGLLLAQHTSWRGPFAAVGVLSLVVWVLARRWLPSLRGHLAHGPNAEGHVWRTLTHAAHVRAYLLSSALVMGTFTIIPYLSIYLVNNVGRQKEELPYVWLCGGAATLFTMTAFGRLSDRYGKLRVFRGIALLAILPTLLLTHLPWTTLAVTLLATTAFMVLTSGRMVPAMALITGSAAPEYRGSFMSVNASVQHLTMSVAPLLSGAILGDTEGTAPLTAFGTVGWVGAAAMLASIFLAGRLRPAAAPVPHGGLLVEAETAV